ncbi:MAG: hypothetical protein WAU05_14545, partial [Nitrospira sp.]
MPRFRQAGTRVKGFSLAQTDVSCPTLSPEAARDRCTTIREQLSRANLFGSPSIVPLHVSASDLQAVTSWRVSPC